MRFLSWDNPLWKAFILCDRCLGKHHTSRCPYTMKCPTCHGNGYLTKKEESIGRKAMLITA